MPTAPANGIEIYYETFGDDDGEPLLLVNGLGSQCISYEPDFCNAFVDRGFFVIRFDNRDVGNSTKIGTPHLDFGPLLERAFAGERVEAPYLLSDMAADAVGVLDALDLPAAHVLGASMGGMIVQAMAIEHPDRVRTMTSIMSTTGDPSVGQPKPDAIAPLLASPPANKDEAVEQAVKATKVIGSPGFPFDEARVRARAAEDWDRAFNPDGVARQLVAILCSGDRTAKLRDVRVPTLVIHGEADPLVDPSGGKATAEAIPGAELKLIPGMGHDLPPAVFDEVADAVAALAAKG
jgi:pimeloyl-ACP methyl ester carboxylesterase